MSRKSKPVIDPYWNTQPGIKRLNALKKKWKKFPEREETLSVSGLLDRLSKKPDDYCSICEDSGWVKYKVPCGPGEDETCKRKCKCKKK